jgi:hypothetical protein
MKLIYIALLLVTPLLAKPVIEARAPIEAAISDPVGSQPLGTHSYEVGFLTPPFNPPANVPTCLQYKASLAQGDKVFTERPLGHPEPRPLPCNANEPHKATRETILGAGWVRFHNTKLLVPAAEFAKNSSLVLARGGESWDAHKGFRNDYYDGSATVAVEAVRGGETTTLGEVEKAGLPRQQFTFELVSSAGFAWNFAKTNLSPQYDVRDGETGGCLQIVAHRDSFSSEHKGGHATETLGAVIMPCEKKTFSWTWTPIPVEVYKSVMAPPTH